MIEILPELLKKKRKRIDEINQVRTAGELLDFVKNNKESKVIFKEDDKPKARGADSKSDEQWQSYHKDVCLAIKSHRLHCCCGQKFYSEDQLESKLYNLIKQLEIILDEELPNNWLHPLFDKYLKCDNFTPKDLELILGNINLRILQRLRSLKEKINLNNGEVK